MDSWQELAALLPPAERVAIHELTSFLHDQMGLIDFETLAVMPAHELAQIFQELPPDHAWRLPPSPDSVNNMLRTASGVLARARHVLRSEQQDVSEWEALATLYPTSNQDAAWQLLDFMQEVQGMVEFQELTDLSADTLVELCQELPEYHAWHLPPSPDSVNNMLRTASGVLARARHVLRSEQQDVREWEALATLYPTLDQGAAWQLLDFMQDAHGLAQLQELADLPADALVELFQALPEYHAWRLPPSPDSVNNMLRTASGVLARARHVLRSERWDTGAWEALALSVEPEEQGDVWILLDFLQEEQGYMEFDALADMAPEEMATLFPSLPEYHSYHSLATDPERLEMAGRLLVRAREVANVVIETDMTVIEFLGQLRDEVSGEPLSGLVVRGYDLETEPAPQSLGQDVTDGRGLFELYFRVTATIALEGGCRHLLLEIMGTQGEILGEFEVDAETDQPEPWIFAIEAPTSPPLPTMAVADVTDVTTATLLSSSGIETLEDVLTERELLNTLSLSADSLAFLEANANLSPLTARTENALEVNRNLIELEYTDLSSIARVPLPEFVSSVSEKIPESQAARLHSTAAAQDHLLNSLAHGALVELAGGREPAVPVGGIPAKHCTCRDCDSAVSPGAYLADLLRYAINHVRIRHDEWSETDPVDLERLTSWFHQPFGKLPASCDAVEETISLIRIVVEVLQDYLGAPTSLTDSAQKAHNQYLWTAYESILGELGTSYTELRLVVAGTITNADGEKSRQRLAGRIGIPLEAEGIPDVLAWMLHDPPSLTEKVLQGKFGLAGTHFQPRPAAAVDRCHLLTLQREHLREQWKSEDRQEEFWPADRAIVDPILVGPDDMRPQVHEPGSSWNPNPVRDMWQDRQLWLLDRLQMIETSYQDDDSVSRLIGEYVWAGQGPLSLDEFLDHRQELVQSDGQQARQLLQDDYQLEDTRFRQLMDLLDKKEVSGEPLDEAEVAQLLQITLDVLRRRETVRPGGWLDQEKANEISLSLRYFWINTKKPDKDMRLHLDQEGRETWQQVLRKDSRRPILDPDLVQIVDLEQPYGEDMAFILWDSRTGILRRLRDDLEGLGDLDLQLRQALDMDADELEALAQAYEEGEEVEESLAQRGLTPATLAFLARMRALPSVLDREREEILDILIQVIKERDLHGSWRREEAERGLTLSLDFFQLPPQGKGVPFAGSTWLAPSSARRAWEKRLRARSEMMENTRQALHDAVAAAEQAALPPWRDALVDSLDEPEMTLEEKGRWLTDRLLIEVMAGSCRNTTRVGQAIETLQGLIFGIRSGRLFPFHADMLEKALDWLILQSEAFEEEWRWLGSYATWRGAMFVFLYPENLLAPTLRRRQTPGFRQLVDDLGTGGILSAERAAALAEDFTRYVQDVANLKVRATCQTNLRSSDMVNWKRSRLFVFAQSGFTGPTYWSAYDPLSKDKGYEQSFWQRVPTLPPNSEVIGAVPYRSMGGEHHILLLAKGLVEGRTALICTRFDLNRGAWDNPTEDPPALELPEGVTGISVMQAYHENLPPRVVISVDEKILLRVVNEDGTGWVDDSGTTSATSESAEGDLKGWKATLPTLKKHTDIVLKAAIEVQRSSQTKPGVFSLVFSAYKKEKNDRREYGIFCSTYRVGSTVDEKNILRIADRRNWNSLPYKGIVMTPVPSDERAWKQIPYDLHAFCGETWLQISNIWTQDAYAPMIKISKTTNHICAWDAVAPTWGPSFGYDRSRLFAYHIHQQSVDRRTGGPFTGRYQVYWVQPYFNKKRRLIPVLHYGDIIIGPRATSRWAASASQRAVEANAGEPLANQTYIEEIFLHVPLQIALELQRAKQFLAALDWLRTIYDYSGEAGIRRYVPYALKQSYQQWKIGARLDERGLLRDPGWLLDPLNPHAAATLRPAAYNRYILMTVIRCLLDYADAEFAADTPESVARARGLYQTALDLLQGEELRVEKGPCEQLKHQLRLPEEASPGIKAAYDRLGRELDAVDEVAIVEELVSELQSHMAEGRLGEAIRLVNETRSTRVPGQNQAAMAETETRRREELYASLVTQPGLVRSLSVLAIEQDADTHFLQPVPSITAHILQPSLDTVGLSVYVPGSSPEIFQPRSSLAFCIAPNPIPAAMRLRAEVNLLKIRTCRNFAGMQRPLEIYSAPIEATSGLPSVIQGRISVPAASAPQATPYRYDYLVERARQLVDRAAQMEAAFLAALEKYDAERYNQMKARQDLRLARAGVRLREFHVREAEMGVFLAQFQRQRAVIQSDTYEDWINAGPSAFELAMIRAYEVAGLARQDAATINAFVQATQAMVTAATASFGAGAAAAGAATLAAASAMGAQASYRAIAAETRASIASAQASWERRRQAWELQKALANQDIRIGTQQIALASTRVDVTEQELAIGQMQESYAQDVSQYLANKFTNKELYAWMSEILDDLYRFFLEQATSVARMAEYQLAFERQEAATSIIQPDYWEAPAEASAAIVDGKVPDRRGMTGSARLLADIYALDQHRFETEKRKLQLSKSLSLAQLAPYELQRFRETGLLQFNTPMALFNRDFPGHYLRLIKRVRTSVIALIPPVEGIRATLSNAGISQVTVSNQGVFQNKRLKRLPESVALTSPTNATGLFDLTPTDGQMLLPFEGMGVDTAWELSMPRASNPVDFDTIADVILTIEYTALESFLYRQQVIAGLERSLEGELSFSFRHQFPDAWYDLHNPKQSATPMVVQFTIRPEDFPPNVEDLQIAQALLYFVRAEGEDFELEVQSLNLAGKETIYLAGAQSSSGKISTRMANGSTWRRLIGNSPAGEWTLSLASDDRSTGELVTGYFAEEKIEDILLVITYRGLTPPWYG